MATTDKDSSVTQKATAATYSFAADTGDGTGIVLEDLTGFDVSSANVFGVPASASIKETELANGAVLFYKGSKAGTLRFRCTNTANTEITETSAKTITAINYNGGASDDLSDGTTINDIDRGIAIEVDGAGTITATVEFKGAGTNDIDPTGTLQAAFVDERGTLLGEVVTDPIKNSTKTTVTAKTTEATVVYLVFSRNGATKQKSDTDTSRSGTGGLDVTKIEVAPAE